ncbi:HEXXH motif domain-containing protein [Streptomyces omiyaensis]|uniref:HEXXH motif domain-containing protein n=1 Tax=Streptomyces omiyaensis TaxID=68247 RepID=UPI0036F67ECF
MQTAGGHEPARAAHHLVPSAHFEALASGRGGPEVVRFLRTTEYSRRLLLLRALLDGAAATPAALGPLPPVDSAWESLTAAQERAPEEFRELLLHPQVGVWLGHGMRRLRHTAWGDGPLWTDLGHLFAVCAVAALRAGLPLRTAVPLRDGDVMFPALGLARLPGRPRWSTAEVVVEAGRLTVEPHREGVGPPPAGADGDAPGWLGLRRLRARAAGRAVSVWLDDVDPYRELGEPLPPHRLGADRTARWQEGFERALEVLEECDPETAAALAEALRSLTAVPAPPGGRVRSASSGDSFGGLLSSPPPDPVAFAVTLVHEFQHGKLGALTHLLTLERDDGTERHHAPWREDPRPLSGLLQGAYAFLGIADFRSRHLDRVVPAGRVAAEFELALVRRQAREAVATLAADPALTAHGRRFVAGMAARLPARPADRRIRPVADALAALAATDHRTEWRIRHLVPDPEDVRALARAYVSGTAPGFRPAAPAVVPDRSGAWSHSRVRLVRRVLGGSPGAPSAARALLLGDPSAPEAYARLLAEDPDSPDAWTGLVLALATASPAARPLLRRPDLLRPLHHELRTLGTPAAPAPLAHWLADTALGAPPRDRPRHRPSG